MGSAFGYVYYSGSPGWIFGVCPDFLGDLENTPDSSAEYTEILLGKIAIAQMPLTAVFAINFSAQKMYVLNWPDRIVSLNVSNSDPQLQ